MELEKRLERVEKMLTGLWVGFVAALVVSGLACVLSLVAVFSRPAAGPTEPSTDAAPEKPEPPVRKPSYLDDLERLEALKAKGALTQQEFDAKKQQLLAAPPPPAAPPAAAAAPASDVDELDKLLRNLHALYNKNILTINDYQAKKQQYLQRKVTVKDLTKDLEKVQKLYDESILNINEFQALKQQVLAGDPVVGKK